MPGRLMVGQQPLELSILVRIQARQPENSRNSMAKIIELKIKNPQKIYQELAETLSPYRKRPAGSVLFIVEGTKKNPVIGLRYPGKKLRKREVKQLRKNSVLWANLYDFEVVAYKGGWEDKGNQFTFSVFMEDFYKNKKGNKNFWRCIEEIYYKNVLAKKPPKTKGINSKMFLLMLKWIWIQEDFNYRFGWKDVNSSVRYVLENRTGSRTAKGAGRAKFFAALILLNYFTLEQVKKIIPLY